MAPTPSLLTTVLDGKFRIERALASGAGGDVYEATHLTLGSRVAVKVLRDGAAKTSEARRRFLHEARIAASIQSDHVVRVFDFAAHEQDAPYIVMELLQGETLAQRVRRVGPLPVATAVDYVIQAANALALLHEGGVVHRDVKPSNLFLARDSEGKERVKLLDFGVAAFRRSVSESSITAGKAMIGTPRYMAPEQVRSTGAVDARADVWALGVTLYELLAGRPPFDAESVLTVLKQIQRKAPAPLRSRRSAVPPKLAALVHGCLEKSPVHRPANARVLVEALVLLRASLEEAGPSESPGDALDLSWNDPDVEELRPVRRVARRRVVTATLLGTFALTVLTAFTGVLTTGARRTGPVVERAAAPQAGAAESAAPLPTAVSAAEIVPLASPALARAPISPSSAVVAPRAGQPPARGLAPTKSANKLALPPSRLPPTAAPVRATTRDAATRDDDVPLE